jgi:hypothetical protein
MKPTDMVYGCDYYNVHALRYLMQGASEWQQIREDGKPTEDVYIVDSSFCINSPWREEVFRLSGN